MGVIRKRRAFHRGRNAAFPGGPQKVPGELPLEQHLAAGERQAAARAAIVRAVFKHRLHHFLHRHVPSDHGFFSLHHHGFYVVPLGFRIAAPPALQETPFQENDRADAVSIVDGVALDIKDAPFCLIIISRHTLFSSCRAASGSPAFSRSAHVPRLKRSLISLKCQTPAFPFLYRVRLLRAGDDIVLQRS